METIIIVMVLVALSLMIFFDRKLHGKKDKSNSSYTPPPSSDNQTSAQNNNPPVYVREQEPLSNKIYIRGLYYNNVTIKDVGSFYGLAYAETNNIYDKYAVSIYRADGKKLGFAPAGTEDLHRYILDHGGKVRILGELYCPNYSERPDLIFGEFYVICEEGKKYFRWELPDKKHDDDDDDYDEDDDYEDNNYEDDDVQGNDYDNNINIRKNNHNDNYESEIPEEERIYKRPNLKSYPFYSNGTAPKGKFSGYAVPSEKFDFDIFNEDNVKIGEVCDLEYLYNTINKFDNGKVPVWGEIYDHKKHFTENLIYIPGRCTKNKIEKSKNEFFNEE